MTVRNDYTVITLYTDTRYNDKTRCNDTLTTVLSTSLGKTFFAWRFILNENILL